MPIREYFCPSTLDHASGLLQSYRDKGKVLAGGTDLLLQMNLPSDSDTILVSLRELAELRQLREASEGGLFIGAMVRHAEVAQSSLVDRHFPALAKASSLVGSPSIRNQATIGGNICNASPSADTAPPLLAYDGKAVIVTPEGEKVIDLEGFFTGPSTTVLRTGEVLKGFLLTPRPGWVSAYEKIGLRKAMEIAIVNVCVALAIDEKRNCSDVRIALGAVAPTPIRAKKAERILRHQKITADLIQTCAEAAVKETKPISDIRASADYRKKMVHFLVKKMVSNLAGVG
jgi:carbon-monoxide dehydrogenase medium subunit